MKVAIAGASGFVGKMLVKALRPEHHVIALGRSRREAEQSLEWRACDLFSLEQTEAALEGAEVAIYLVHSMLPRASLTQSRFEDLDLLLADNFARAAKKHGIQRIIYLGGLLPEGRELSDHLRSRQEVEEALGSTGVPVTTLRSGLILGSEGSSFQMLYLLVSRLPVMICPRWTSTLTQCTDADDIVDLIRFCIRDNRTQGRTFDVGGPEVLSYRQLMALLAEELGKKRVFFSIPLFTPGLSRLWVQLITGGSRNLVAPLVQSLAHEMVVRDHSLMQLYGRSLRGIRQSLRKCIAELEHTKPTLRSSTRERIRQLRGHPEVRSIQRLPLPQGRNATWAAAEYFRWLPRFLKPWIRVEEANPGIWGFRFSFWRRLFLELQQGGSSGAVDARTFYIRGGLLSAAQQNPGARLEFREVLGGHFVLAAIHEFRPALPWLVYKWTQALLHLWVMEGFRRYLGRLSKTQWS